jgi:hypothetical protein
MHSATNEARSEGPRRTLHVGACTTRHCPGHPGRMLRYACSPGLGASCPPGPQPSRRRPKSPRPVFADLHNTPIQPRTGDRGRLCMWGMRSTPRSARCPAIGVLRMIGFATPRSGRRLLSGCRCTLPQVPAFPGAGRPATATDPAPPRHQPATIRPPPHNWHEVVRVLRRTCLVPLQAAALACRFRPPPRLPW